MEGSISCIAFTFTILIVLTSAAVQEELYCCGVEVVAFNLSSRRCETGRPLPLPCDELFSVPYLEVTEKNFTMKGQRQFFRVTKQSHTVQLSPFCLGNAITNGTKDGNLSVLFCNSANSNSMRHQRLQFHQDIIDSLEYESPKMSFNIFVCILSGVLLAISSVLYVVLPQTRDIVGTCVFHIAVNQSLFYFGCAWAGVVLSTGYVEPYLGSFCIVFWYLLAFVELSSFMWCAILTFHLANTFRKNEKMNKFRRLCQYVLVGYGVPALLVAFCNIHIQANYYFREDVLELSCNEQFDLMSSFYGVLPLVIISLINIYLFVNLQQRSKTAPPSPPECPEHSTISRERFAFRFALNKKLFTLLIVPWMVIAFLSLPMSLLASLLENHESLAHYVDYLTSGVYSLLCSNGIVMFYSLIISYRNL